MGALADPKGPSLVIIPTAPRPLPKAPLLGVPPKAPPADAP
jgi:hypothetical protein